MRKILILAANPNDVPPSRLDEEVRDIYEALDRAHKRDEFEVVQRWAVRPRDLQRAMLEVSPQIVHFTGHSDGAAGLFFEDVVGQPSWLLEMLWLACLSCLRMSWNVLF
ncbi:MAG: hypothetical protein AAGE59_36215 [Cyanobacteria bacterium P01_F01_bin.86]